MAKLSEGFVPVPRGYEVEIKVGDLLALRRGSKQFSERVVVDTGNEAEKRFPQVSEVTRDAAGGVATVSMVPESATPRDIRGIKKGPGVSLSSQTVEQGLRRDLGDRQFNPATPLSEFGINLQAQSRIVYRPRIAEGLFDLVSKLTNGMLGARRGRV